MYEGKMATAVVKLMRVPNKLGVLRILFSELWNGAGPGRNPANAFGSLEDHVHAAYRWLVQAQNATPDKGVAASYDLFSGWTSSYPETTGYIIPTFLKYATVFGEQEGQDRALLMADWECEVQLPSGAVRSGTLETPEAPAVFNTGQVLFGWVSAFLETREEKYERSVARAANWLVEQQDDDGSWRRGLSALVEASEHTYNVRSAWGLALSGVVFEEKRWVDAARRNGEWVLTQQNEHAWFHNNSFDQQPPLLHTIGYVTEGLLELGALLKDEPYILSARRAADALLRLYNQHGWLAGRLDEYWQPAAQWRCLTGDAQVALTWLRLYELTGDTDYLAAGRQLNQDIMKTCKLRGAMHETIGAVKGSHPIWGGYLRFSYPNWAPKFLLDSLLLEYELTPDGAKE
jgi:hypothetical protein